MGHRHLLVLIGFALIAIGILERGWFLLAVWFGCNFLALGIAHARGAHKIFGKRLDGTLPAWSWFLFLPWLLYTSAVWHAMRLFSREAAHHVVTDELVVGRRLLSGELDDDFANYIDLTAEFAEPRPIRRSKGYVSFPILDGSACDADALRELLGRLPPGRTFIHCAQGHGRTAFIAVAVLLKSGAVQTVQDGLEMLKAVRPGIRLNAVQRRAIEDYAASLHE